MMAEKWPPEKCPFCGWLVMPAFVFKDWFWCDNCTGKVERISSDINSEQEPASQSDGVCEE